MIHAMRTVLGVGALAAGLLVGAGCSNQLTASDLRANATPELHNTARSDEQVKNLHARVVDTEGREAWSDLDRILLLNRASRLTPYPVP